MEEGAAMDKKQTPAMLLKIKSMRENLSKAELLVCDYIIEHPEEVIYLSVSELAAKSGVSDATVIRASQKIGSSSYQDLKDISCAGYSYAAAKRK